MAKPIVAHAEQDWVMKSIWFFITPAAGRSGVQLIPKVGGPERRPRGGCAEVTGKSHDVPLLQHEELVVRGEVAALFSMSVRADDTFEAMRTL